MLGVRLEAGRLSLSSDTDILTEKFFTLGMVHSDLKSSGALGSTPAEEVGTSRAFMLSLRYVGCGDNGREELTLHWLNPYLRRRRLALDFPPNICSGPIHNVAATAAAFAEAAVG